MKTFEKSVTHSMLIIASVLWSGPHSKTGEGELEEFPIKMR
jgi:hypothetical protein